MKSLPYATEDEICAAQVFLNQEGIADPKQYLQSRGYSSERIAGIEQTTGCEVEAKRECLKAFAETAELREFVKPASEYKKLKTEWIIPQWLPKGVICVVFGDGGAGKSSLSRHIVSCLSSGRPTIMDYGAQVHRNKIKILYCNHEDDIEKVTTWSLDDAQADMDNVLIPNLDNDTSGRLEGMRLNSKSLYNVVKEFKPDIVVFDPLQSFIPQDINMAARNQMRACMTPLEYMAHTFGTTFIVVCHTNKRQGAYGRDRLSDSSDIWDIARAVFAVGETKDKGIRYVSVEKSNYSVRPESVLFSIGSKGIEYYGKTAKHQREFVEELPSAAGRPSTQRDACKEAILQALEEGQPSGLESSYLCEYIENQGFSKSTIDRAKAELKTSGTITYKREGFSGAMFTQLVRAVE